MLDFVTQQRILEPILKNPNNRQCADCPSISPTWASLDFGVFLCSNCSGAHRALGPTVTRVRSANLDKWQDQWVENMQLGNIAINKYWEADPKVNLKKPRADSSLAEIGRFVHEKYIKRSFVANKIDLDPLTCFKKGTYQISKIDTPNQCQTPVQAPVQQLSASQTFKNEVNLLQFEFQSPQAKHVQKSNEEEEEFTDYAQAGSYNHTNGQTKISFDTLLNQQRVPQQNYGYLKGQNITLHHPFNASIAQHNLVYNAQFYPQFQQGQYFGNPNLNLRTGRQFGFDIHNLILMLQGETAVYVVLGILILAFLFFVGNTIRCYLNKPKYIDEDDEHEMEDNVSGKI